MKNITLSLLTFLFASVSWGTAPPKEGLLAPKLIYEQDKTALTTAIHVVMLTGSAEDPQEKSGLANILAELMIRGTKKKNRAKFQTEVERMGASIGASVSYDTFSFEGRVIKENTIPLLKMIGEFLLQPALSNTEFESLKKEILGEISHRKNQNGRLAGLAIRRTIYENTPLQRPSDGGLSTVARITLADVQRAYNDRFHRGNIIFAATGPLDEKEIKDVLTEIWLKFPDGLRVTRRVVPLQIPKTPTLMVVHKPKTSTGNMFMAQQGITAQEPLRYHLNVGNFSFGGEKFINRLFKVIRGDLGWTYAIGSTYFGSGGLTYQPSIYLITSTPSVEFSAKTLLKTLAMWKEYYQSGVKEEEVRLAQESLVNSFPFESDTAEKRLGRRLSNYLYNVPILSSEEFEKTIKAVSGPSIKTALTEKHTSSGWLISLVADSKVVEQELADEQKEVPEAQRIKISKIFTPSELVD